LARSCVSTRYQFAPLVWSQVHDVPTMRALRPPQPGAETGAAAIAAYRTAVRLTARTEAESISADALLALGLVSMAASDPQPLSPGSHDSGVGDDEQANSQFWQQVALAAATAAGSLAWISLIGSGVMALRLGKAGLPVEPVVALMSTEHRFAVGAGILAAPLLAGSFAAFVDWVVSWSKEGVNRKQRQHLVVLTIVVTAPVGYWLLRPDVLLFVAELVAVAIAAAVALAAYRGNPRTLMERIVVFLAVIVSVGAIAVAAERIGPVSFDTATLTVTDGNSVEGGFVTSTDYAVLVIPDDAACPIIKAVPRTEITRIEVSDKNADIPEC
jgi:hypothetical protein